MRYLIRSLLVIPLLAGGIQVYAQSAEPNIWAAAGEGNLKALRAQITRGADVNQEAPGIALTPLIAAIIGNQPRATRMLVKAGADANKPTQDGQTPMHVVAFLGYDKVAKELIRGGADIFARNSEGRLPASNLELDWGTTQYIADMLSLNLVEAEVKSGREAIGELIDKESQKRAKSDPWIAVFTGDERAMKRHIRRIDDLDAIHEESGSTALSIASALGYTSIANMLLDAGADPDARNRDQSTPLHGAALMGNADIVERLLALGADSSIRSDTGTNAMDLANLDWMTTEAIAAALTIPFDFDEVTSGKKKVIELLQGTEGR